MNKLEENTTSKEDLCEYKKSRNFVDNKKLYEQFKQWKEALEKNPKTRMPEYIGECILTIANGFQHYYKFRGYSDLWKDQMIADAVYNCVKYGSNFDHRKYNNPHAYLTQICYMAFINRIPREQAENALKWRMLVEISGNIEDEDFEQHVNQPFLDDISEKLQVYEKSLDKKKEKQVQASQKVKSQKQHKPMKNNLLGI